MFWQTGMLLQGGLDTYTQRPGRPAAAQRLMSCLRVAMHHSLAAPAAVQQQTWNASEICGACSDLRPWLGIARRSLQHAVSLCCQHETCYLSGGGQACMRQAFWAESTSEPVRLQPWRTADMLHQALPSTLVRDHILSRVFCCSLLNDMPASCRIQSQHHCNSVLHAASRATVRRQLSPSHNVQCQNFCMRAIWPACILDPKQCAPRWRPLLPVSSESLPLLNAPTHLRVTAAS
jgi:hypothetical protein